MEIRRATDTEMLLTHLEELGDTLERAVILQANAFSEPPRDADHALELIAYLTDKLRVPTLEMIEALRDATLVVMEMDGASKVTLDAVRTRLDTTKLRRATR